ncbi:MAG: hypothetical protein KGL39_38460 [Patescibacteria group bacterium]|nr:hypothetical protein [Patescibacteria group bacterium]
MIGRPSRYTNVLADSICERIACGETLVAICRGEGIPNISTVLRWLSEGSPYASFRENYARAKQLRLEVMAEEIQQIADECRPGEKTKKKHVAWLCAACQRDARWQGKRWVHSEDGSPICDGVQKPEEITEDETVTADMVERARLQVDARKWLLARLAAATYGDRVQQEISGPGGQPMTLIVKSAKAKPE